MNLGNYFALFANILYGTASWSLSDRARRVLGTHSCFLVIFLSFDLIDTETEGGALVHMRHYILDFLDRF